MLFNGWSSLVRTLVVGALGYLAFICILRISGKRTLSKMNAFDLIVTVALGSTLASMLLSNDVSLAQGITAFGLLVLLQFVITWLSVRSRGVSHVVKAEPTFLVHCGKLLHGAPRRERVTRAEVEAAVRARGIASLEEVRAVILETDGSFSVLRTGGSPRADALSSIPSWLGYPLRPPDENGTEPRDVD